MTNRINALYYPWIAMSNLESLKKALVYFDKVYLLCPPTVDAFAGAWTWEHLSGVWDNEHIRNFEAHLEAFFRFREETRELVTDGILQFIDPYAFGVPSLADYVDPWSAKEFTDRAAKHVRTISKSDRGFREKSLALTKAIISDFEHSEFLRIPTALKTFIAMGWMFDYGLSGATLSEFYGYNLRQVMIGQGTASPETLRLDLSHFMREKNDRWSSKLAVEVESYVAQSLIVNRTLLAATELQAAPFTDQLDHFAFLEEKFNRIAKNGEILDAIRRRRPEFSLEEHALGMQIIETELPNLEGFRWDEILAIRQGAASELERFRLEVASLGSELSGSSGEDLRSRIDKIIKQKVAPAVLDLEERLRCSKLKALKAAFTKAQSLKPLVPLSVSIVVGVPVEVGFLISAGLLAVDTALDAYLQRREIRSVSGFSYLLNYR